MNCKAIILLLAAFFLVPGLAGAASEKDFEAETTENLINLCTASPDDPLYGQAVNFCHGFLVGAYQYHVATHSGPEAEKWICIADPPPSRNDAIAMFIEWAKAHPQYWKEPPVETEFRFLREKWPCNP